MSSTDRNLVKRLSNYKNILCKLKALGFVKVFSDNLADALGISSAQVRKDFSIFELKGNKKAGYVVADLIEQIRLILGKDKIQKVVVVGCGKMGKAIMSYHGFSKVGIRVVAAFDSDPSIIDPDLRIPILELSELPDTVEKEEAKVAIMTVPEAAAAQVYDLLEKSGIEGILNFAPVQLRSTDRCQVHNINIEIELENMFYFIKTKQDGCADL